MSSKEKPVTETKARKPKKHNFFGTVCTIVNRAPWSINIRYDGKDMELEAYEEREFFPLVAVPYAINQNPLFGSEDPRDPSQFQTLIGIKDGPAKLLKRFPAEPLTDEEEEQHKAAPQRLNRSIMAEERGDPKSRDVVRGKKSQSPFDARTGQSIDGGVFMGDLTN